MATIIQPVRAVYYGRYGQYGWCMVHTPAGAAGLAGAAGARFIRTDYKCMVKSVCRNIAYCIGLISHKYGIYVNKKLLKSGKLYPEKLHLPTGLFSSRR